MFSIAGAEAVPMESTDLTAAFLRPDGVIDLSGSSQSDLVNLEQRLRDAALSTNDVFLMGLNAIPGVEGASGQSTPLFGSNFGTLFGSAGVYQLSTFPLTRFNGIPLPTGSRIRFADPSRWFSVGMESRLLTISVDGTKKFFSWDAHLPVGNKPHAYYHVNQQGMASVMSATDHSALSGAALVQAKQLRYLKIGGRIFLIVGVVVDTVQLGGAAYESYQTGSAKPVGKQFVRTASGWAAAWAGAKAGVAVGALAGVETGPGVVLTAIGGGFVGGIAGYFGGNWIADWLLDD
jgi:hypothetical protein